jgi:hypothetical protein
MRTCVLLAVVISASFALAQNGFVTTIPDEPVNFSQVSDGSAWIEGHWVPVDPSDRKSAMLGMPERSWQAMSRAAVVFATSSSLIV